MAGRRRGGVAPVAGRLALIDPPTSTSGSSRSRSATQSNTSRSLGRAAPERPRSSANAAHARSPIARKRLWMDRSGDANARSSARSSTGLLRSDNRGRSRRRATNRPASTLGTGRKADRGTRRTRASSHHGSQPSVTSVLGVIDERFRAISNWTSASRRTRGEDTSSRRRRRIRVPNENGRLPNTRNGSSGRSTSSALASTTSMRDVRSVDRRSRSTATIRLARCTRRRVNAPEPAPISTTRSSEPMSA